MLSSSMILFALMVVVVIVAAAVVPELFSGINVRRIVLRTMFLSFFALVLLIGYVMLIGSPQPVAESVLQEDVTGIGGSGFETEVAQVVVTETAVSPTATVMPPTVTSTNTPVPPPTETAVPPSPTFIPIRTVPPTIVVPLPPTPAPIVLPANFVDPWLPVETLYSPISNLPQGVSTGARQFVSNESVNWFNTNPGNTWGRLYSYDQFYSNAGLCEASNGLYGIYTQMIVFDSAFGAEQFYRYALSNATPTSSVGDNGYWIVSPGGGACATERYTVAFQRGNIFYKVRVLVHQDAAHLANFANSFAWDEAYRMDAHLSQLAQ